MPSKKRNIEQELLDDLDALSAYNRGEIELHQRTFVKAHAPAEIRKWVKPSPRAFR